MPILRLPAEVTGQYENSESINQSGLKVLMSSGIQFYLDNQETLLKNEKKWYEDKEHFLLGHAIDTEMTLVPGTFQSRYYTSTLEKKPSDTMKTVLHMVLDMLPEGNIYSIEHSLYREAIHSAMNTVPTKNSKGEPQVGYYMTRAKANWQEDTRMKDIVEDPICKDYWVDIVKARGKEILTQQEDTIVKVACHNFRNHENTKHLFQDRPNVITVYQFQVYFVVNGVLCKGLLDKIDIHTDIKVIKPQDIKSMRGYTLTFHKSIRARRYDIQGAFYTEGLRQNLPELSQFVGVDLSNYSIENFTFIVESTTNPGLPMCFRLSDALLEVGTSGNEKLKGYEQLVDSYAYWQSVDFNVEAAMISERGILEVDEEFNHNRA